LRLKYNFEAQTKEQKFVLSPIFTYVIKMNMPYQYSNPFTMLSAVSEKAGMNVALHTPYLHNSIQHLVCANEMSASKHACLVIIQRPTQTLRSTSQKNAGEYCLFPITMSGTRIHRGLTVLNRQGRQEVCLPC